ncbi:hypothetical protein ES708_07494 [subsurface metagenome]
MNCFEAAEYNNATSLSWLFPGFSFIEKHLNGISEDNYEVNNEDLSPELIVESPKNANYFDQLDFKPYGTYFFAPKYIQRYVGQTSLNNIFFRLYDANGGDFSQFRIFVDDIEQYSYNWYDNIIEFNIASFLSTSGTHNIITQAFSEGSLEWVSSSSILNVTLTSPCIAPFYEDFCDIQNRGSNILEWNIDANNPSYDYSISINGIEVKSQTVSYYNNIDLNYYSYPEFIDTLDYVNEIKLEVDNGTGEVIINQFNITIAADNDYLGIQSLYRNCDNNYPLTLMESEGFTIKTSAFSDHNDLEKIVIIANNLPIYTINNVENNNEYEAPINLNSLTKLLDDNSNYDYGYGYITSNIEFRAIAVDKYRRSSFYDDSPSQYVDIRDYLYNQLIKKTENVGSGRNIETIEMIEEHNPDIEYTLTVVTDVLAPTTLTIAGSTGEPFENQYGWDHCYEDNRNNEENYNCQIFGGFDKDQDWYRGGMVFWVSIENQSAVQFPMIAKIVYPEEIQPDEINNIWKLQFMHWVENCEINQRGWQIYSNETISENRDETLKKVGDNAIEVLIYSQGLYAFGMEPGEDYDRGGLFISSFPIGLILFSIGIAITSISLKTKFKLKKK